MQYLDIRFNIFVPSLKILDDGYNFFHVELCGRDSRYLSVVMFCIIPYLGNYLVEL